MARRSKAFTSERTIEWITQQLEAHFETHREFITPNGLVAHYIAFNQLVNPDAAEQMDRHRFVAISLAGPVVSRLS